MALEANKISPLQVSYVKGWTGLTTSNHFDALFQRAPQLASQVMTKLFQMDLGKTLDGILNKYPAKEMPDDIEYEWYIKGDDRRPYDIVSYTAVDTNRPGVNGTVFKLVTSEKVFVEGDVLIFDDREFAVRVMSEPYIDGLECINEVAVHPSNNPSMFIDPALMQKGKQVSKLYTSVTNTLSKKGGTVNHTSPFKMRNIFSTLRKEYVVPGNMQSRNMVITVGDPNNALSQRLWIKELEAVFEYQWAMEKANNLIYSKYNKNSNGTFQMKGDSGFPVMEGSGLREQIAPSYKFYYNTFTIDYLLDVLTNISINSINDGDREFVLLTGERGMIQFHQAIENKVALFQPLGNPSRLFGSGQNLGFGGQYVEWKGPQGIKVTVMHMPSYDDPIDNRTVHPNGGFTESYRYTIMNVGKTDGEGNIMKVYPKGRRDLRWYVCGSTTPYGPNTSMSSMGSSSVDGYEVFSLTTQGIMLRNPLSCAEFIYAGTRGY